MNISGSFALSISDLNLDFNDIEAYLPIKPAKIIRRGQMVGKLKNIEAPYDIWVYEVLIADEKDIFKGLSLLLDNILPYSDYLKKARNKYNSVGLNCYLRSDFGQVGFQLRDEEIFKLADLGLCLDFHILSFGAVRD